MYIFNIFGKSPIFGTYTLGNSRVREGLLGSHKSAKRSSAGGAQGGQGRVAGRAGGVGSDP